jgi:hypothetical protein
MSRHTYVEVLNLRGFPYGVHYFDNPKVIYVAPEVLEKIKNQELGVLSFFMLTYRENQKPIEEIAIEIVGELERCPTGPFELETIKELEEKARPFPNPDLVFNPGGRVDKGGN